MTFIKSLQPLHNAKTTTTQPKKCSHRIGWDEKIKCIKSVDKGCCNTNHNLHLTSHNTKSQGRWYNFPRRLHFLGE